MFLCQTKSIKQQQGQLCIHEKRSNVPTFDITCSASTRYRVGYKI